MSITATIEPDETILRWTQTTRCRTELVNDDSETLFQINPRNWKGAATISVKNIETGELSFHAQLLTVDAEQPSVSLEPGTVLANRINLSSLYQFPSCGVFELQAHYSCSDGRIESDPVKIEVLATNPKSLVTATQRGSEAGDVFCAWVNQNDDGFSVWLTLINTTWEARFLSSARVENTSDIIIPAISIPANTIPTRQYIAWISGNKLHYVTHENEKFQSNDFELDGDDYEIIPPLLEDRFVEGVRQFAEVLLLKKGSDSCQMRTVLLGESPSMSNEIRKIKSVSPQWFQTVYRSNGERFTFILLPLSRDGNPYVKLAMSLWKARVSPAYPVFLTNWQGTLITADVLLAGDDRIVGAGLVKQENGKKTEYIIQKWSLDKNDELKTSAMPPLLWNEEWLIEHTILRVNGEGTTFMLLKGGPEGKWLLVNGAGDITSLGELSPQINLPANIIFVSQIYPAILYTDTTCGLKLHYLGPKRVYRPPTGAW
jgi:hypothetical protein